MGTERRLVEYAKGRYLNDPEFQARVEMAVQVMAKTHDLNHDADDLGLVTMAAALGLAMEWVDPTTGEVVDR